MCVVAAECTDNVTISPMKKCVQQYTPFTCLSTHGYPPPPTYYWTHYNAGVIRSLGYPSPTSYQLDNIGVHTLGCAAEYYHPYCPEFKAVCYANRTVTVFRQYTLRIANCLTIAKQ